MPYVRLTAPFFDGREKHPRGAELLLTNPPRSAIVLGDTKQEEAPAPSFTPAPEPELQLDPTIDAQPGDTLASLTKAKK